MSIKSTHSVTRDFATQVILRKLEDYRSLTDEQLADMLEIAIHNGYYNFQIVSEVQMRGYIDIEKYPPLILTDIDNLPEYNDAY